MTILFVVPARGGSKGIPKKNLRRIAGYSLTSWALKFASKYSDLHFQTDVCLSSDSKEILDEANKFQRVIKVNRPAIYASDTASDSEVLQHAYSFCSNRTKINYDYVVMLQPTAPSRSHATFGPALLNHISSQGSYTATWSVSTLHDKFRSEKVIKLSDSSSEFILQRKRTFPPRRQDLDLEYYRNGEFYILDSSTLEDPYLIGQRLNCVVTNENPANIDTLEDLWLARRQLKSQILLNHESLSTA